MERVCQKCLKLRDVINRRPLDHVIFNLSLDSKLAEEVERKFFDVLKMKCFDIVESNVESKKCEKYSTWFDRCLDEDVAVELTKNNDLMKIRQF